MKKGDKYHGEVSTCQFPVGILQLAVIFWHFTVGSHRLAVGSEQVHAYCSLKKYGQPIFMNSLESNTFTLNT